MNFDEYPAYEQIDIPYGEYKLRAYTLGSGPKVLFLVHGGPGFPSNYLQDSHAIFADEGYKIVTWDQLGCGSSDKPTHPDLWNLERFVDEMEAVRAFLNLGKVNVLGQSWGGVLSIEYCLKYQKNVNSFILANSTSNVPLMEKGFERLRAALGSETCTMMSRREADQTTDHPEYQAVSTLLFYRHICRTEQWSKAMQFCCNNIAKPVWSAMFGGQVFKCDGHLKLWDRTKDLKHIKVPVLIIHGEHDEIIPECASLAQKHFPNSTLELFRECSHMPFYENPKLYHQVVGSFLHNSTKT